MNICTLAGWQISESITNSEISSEEVTRSYLDRIRLHDKQLGSFITVLDKEALQEAKRADEEIREGKIRSKLHGIPVAIKDNVAVRDTYTTAGSKVFKNNFTRLDSTLVARLRESGAVIIGKLNLHELANGGTSDNPYFGTVRNPWNTSHVPGGSSGGSAAAVAASLCAASIGGDAGGSARIPASLCGVVGLLPTLGRVSTYGGIEDSTGTLASPCPLTRDVRDAAIMMNAMAGRDENDPSTSSEPVPDYESFLNMNIEDLKIGIPTNFFKEEVSNEVDGVVRRAVSVLERLGAEAVEVELWMVKYSRAIQCLISDCESSAYYVRHIEKNAEEYSWDVRARLVTGTFISAVDYIQAQQIRMKMINEYLKLFEKIDVLVSPTTPFTAIPIPPRTTGSTRDSGKMTALFNLLGFPAISVPCGFDLQGLPIGLQIAAPPFQEGLLLGVANVYENKEQWTSKRPPGFP